MSTWESQVAPPHHKVGLAGAVLAVLRAIPLAFLVFGGLALLLVIRMIERPFHGHARPWTPYITQTVCRGSLLILGIRFRTTGEPMAAPGAVVANHSSWLDIFSLNARKRVYFVSKSEVAKWPGIGWLARATGTVFIDRDPKQAHAQKALFEIRLRAGHKLLFFPEGTSSDGLRVLPFKSTLFAAFFTDSLRDEVSIQPVTLSYHAAAGQDPRQYGWWGEMEFAPHLLQTLTSTKQGQITVAYHTPLKVSDFKSRKDLAAACEAAVRSGLDLTPAARSMLSTQQ